MLREVKGDLGGWISDRLADVAYDVRCESTIGRVGPRNCRPALLKGGGYEPWCSLEGVLTVVFVGSQAWQSCLFR